MREYRTHIRDEKEDATPIRDGQYNINLQLKVSVQRKTPDGENRDDTATRHVQTYVKTHEGNMKASCRESDKTLKREIFGHRTEIGEYGKTSYGYSKNTLNKDKGTHSTLLGYR